jgi:glycosyltransferase involved in cell wall biosynthesis
LNTNRPWLTYQDGNSAEYANNPFMPDALRRNTQLHQDCIAYEKKIANDADKVLTTSEWLRCSFIERYGLAPEKVVSIGCGVNAPLPETVPNKDYSSKEMLFIGKEFERKGGDVAIAALNIVRKKFPDAVLHIVGPSSLPTACRNTPGLVFHGFLNRRNREQAAQQAALFAKSPLFLAPSRYEPFGIAPLEAMGWGAAAIVTGQWALAENIEPGVTGGHVKVGDVAGLADEAIALFDSPERLARYGAAARDIVMKKHRWSNVVERLSAVLGEIPA